MKNLKGVLALMFAFLFIFSSGYSEIANFSRGINMSISKNWDKNFSSYVDFITIPISSNMSNDFSDIRIVSINSSGYYVLPKVAYWVNNSTHLSLLVNFSNLTTGINNFTIIFKNTTALSGSYFSNLGAVAYVYDNFTTEYNNSFFESCGTGHSFAYSSGDIVITSTASSNGGLCGKEGYRFSEDYAVTSRLNFSGGSSTSAFGGFIGNNNMFPTMLVRRNDVDNKVYATNYNGSNANSDEITGCLNAYCTYTTARYSVSGTNKSVTSVNGGSWLYNVSTQYANKYNSLIGYFVAFNTAKMSVDYSLVHNRKFPEWEINFSSEYDLNPVTLETPTYENINVIANIYIAENGLYWDNNTFSYKNGYSYTPFLYPSASIGLISDYITYCSEYTNGNAIFYNVSTANNYVVKFIPNVNCNSNTFVNSVYTISTLGSVSFSQNATGNNTLTFIIERENTPKIENTGGIKNVNTMGSMFFEIMNISLWLIIVVIVIYSAVVSNGHWVVPLIVAGILIFVKLYLSKWGL